MDWKREDLAWLGGLVEGEGCFTVRTTKSGKQIVLRLAMTDLDIVQRAHAVAGLGRLYGPYGGKPPRKQYWVWCVYRQDDVVAMIAALWPWLGSRRKARAAEFIEMWKTPPAWANQYGKCGA